nr:unnamed protein product [Callosobruchus analis]
MLNAPKGNKKGKKRITNPQNYIKNEAKRLRNTGNLYLSTSKGKRKDRKEIFKEYWELGDLEKQRQYISASMTVVNPKYRYGREDSHRRPNNAFHFEIRDKKIHVRSLLQTCLCITDRSIRTVIGKRNLFTGQVLSSDLRRKHAHHAKDYKSVLSKSSLQEIA